MTLDLFLRQLAKKCPDIPNEEIEVRVLSVYWSSVQNRLVDAEVESLGYDDNNKILYIEINKTE